MPLQFKNGDCLQDSNTKRTIIHVVNNSGGFGKG